MQVSLKHLLSFALIWLTSLVASYAYAVQPTFHAADPRVNVVHSYETPVQAASSPWGDPVSTPQIYDYESLPLFECAPDIRSASPHALCAYERISSFLAAKTPVKPSLTAHKEALAKVHEKVGKLPKGQPGKFGAPQAGTPKKGYRLDPPHPKAKPGSPETGYHFNYWDYTKGKRGSGGVSDAIPIE